MKQAHFVSLKRQPMKVASLLAASIFLTACASAPQKTTRSVSDDEDYSKRSVPVTSEPAPVAAADVAASSSVSAAAEEPPKSVVAPEPEPVKPVAPAAVKKPAPKPVAKPAPKPAVKADPVAAKASLPKKTDPSEIKPASTPPKQETELNSQVDRNSPGSENTPKEAASIDLAFADKTIDSVNKPVQLRSLDDLPLSLADGWLLQLSALPLTKDKVCVLHNVQENIFDGYETTSVEAWLTSQKIIVKSKSNFDLSYPGSGLTLHDNGGLELDHFTLASTASESVVDVEFPAKRYARKQSLKMVVKTGFWPTWPVTETRAIGFVMNNYHSMLSSLQECATLLQSNQ